MSECCKCEQRLEDELLSQIVQDNEIQSEDDDDGTNSEYLKSSVNESFRHIDKAEEGVRNKTMPTQGVSRSDDDVSVNDDSDQAQNRLTSSERYSKF